MSSPTNHRGRLLIPLTLFWLVWFTLLALGDTDLPAGAVTTATVPSCFAADCGASGWQKAFDRDTGTMQHTAAEVHPTEFDMTLDATYLITGIRYDPRDDSDNGRCTDYNFYLSTDGVSWGSPVASGTWANNGTEKAVSWTATNASYLRFQCNNDAFGVYLSTVEFYITISGGRAGNGSRPIPLD